MQEYRSTETQPRLSQTPKMESFATIFNGFYPLTVAEKFSI